MKIKELNNLIDSPKWKTKKVLYYVKSFSEKGVVFDYFAVKKDIDVFLGEVKLTNRVIGIYKLEKVNGKWDTNPFWKYSRR